MLINTNFTRQLDVQITSWMSRNGLLLLRWSIGLVFLWFGGLKFFTGLSPAEDLAYKTIGDLTFGLLSKQTIVYGLATWEVIIGLGLIIGMYMREVLLLLFLQMIGTFTPLLLYPEEVFTVFPYGLTLEGQYIIKNVVIISGAIVLGATVRHRRMLIRDDSNTV